MTDLINEHMSKVNRTYGSNVMGFGISGKLNRIQVFLYDTSDEKIEEFKNNIYPEEEFLIFRNILELVYPKSTRDSYEEALPLWPDNYILCGSHLLNLYTNNQASLGYRVKDKNGNKGFMTAGHFVYQGRYVTNADRDTIGLCKQCYRRNIMDASYCELVDDKYELSNNIRTFAIDTLSTLSTQPIEGADIIAVGYRNSYHGKVLNHSFKFSFYDNEGRYCIYTDQVLLDFISTPGNSGGVVCYKDKDTKDLMTVGILSGNCTTEVSPVLGRTVAFCCKQNAIQAVMGVKRY
ncbi:MAG: hypothetical protein HDR88_15370 [Bacteroides sp.]|nr:hypothetical protein [Bacteroides sp.]